MRVSNECELNSVDWKGLNANKMQWEKGQLDVLQSIRKNRNTNSSQSTFKHIDNMIHSELLKSSFLHRNLTSPKRSCCFFFFLHLIF